MDQLGLLLIYAAINAQEKQKRRSLIIQIERGNVLIVRLNLRQLLRVIRLHRRGRVRDVVRSVWSVAPYLMPYDLVRVE